MKAIVGIIFMIFSTFSCGDTKVKDNQDQSTMTDMGHDTAIRDQSHDSNSRNTQDGDMSIDLDNLPECKYGTSASKHIIIKGTNPKADASFVLALCAYDVGIGESSLYRSDYLEMTWKGEKYQPSKDTITYTNSLHNWRDSLKAEFNGNMLKWKADYVFPEVDKPGSFNHVVSVKTGSEESGDIEMKITCKECRNYEFFVKEQL